MRRGLFFPQNPALGFMSVARTTTALTAAARFNTCLLCDVDYDSWGEHSSQTSHIARSAICRTFVAPDRHDSMMQQLWKHIRLDFEYIDDVTQKKEDRRRSRIASTMRHLQSRGVLRDSIPHIAADGTFVVGKDSFVNLMMLGEAYARQETLDRAARLMPRLDARELSSVAHYILSKRHLARLFDLFNMSALPVRAAGSPADGEAPAPALRMDEKAVVLLSALGELQTYARQDRPHSVANKAAAEALVLNVLGTHVMENAIAELLHAVLQRVVEEGTPVWAAHCEKSATKLFEGTAAPPPPLAAAPSPRKTETEIKEGAFEDLMRCCALSEECEARGNGKSHKLVWQELTRALTLEMSVTNPVNKSATFAPPMPRLANKKKS